jgi:hypothetical protein
LGLGRPGYKLLEDKELRAGEIGNTRIPSSNINTSGTTSSYHVLSLTSWFYASVDSGVEQTLHDVNAYVDMLSEIVSMFINRWNPAGYYGQYAPF